MLEGDGGAGAVRAKDGDPSRVEGVEEQRESILRPGSRIVVAYIEVGATLVLHHPSDLVASAPPVPL